MLTSQAQWNPKGLGVEVEEGNFAGSSSGRSGLAIGCSVPELPKNKLAWLGLTMRPLKKRTIIMKCKEASLVKSLDAGRRGGNERRDRRRGMRPEVGADERREVGEKCQLAGHIRRQAQMRQPKADSLARQLILNAQAMGWDRLHSALCTVYLTSPVDTSIGAASRQRVPCLALVALYHCQSRPSHPADAARG